MAIPFGSSVPGAILAVAVFCLPPSTGSAQLDLGARGGTLSGAAEIRVDGPVGTQFFLFLSTRPGPLPLVWADPGDPRSLGLGLDLFPILAGRVPFASEWRLPVPAEPSLAGLLVRAQALAVPGHGARLFGALSPLRGLHLWHAASWEPLKVWMPFRRTLGAGLFMGDGRLLMTGGGQGGMLSLNAEKETLWFDPVERTLVPGPDMTVARGIHTLTQLGDGRVLLAGGVDAANDPLESVELFDPGQGLCVPLAAKMGDKRSGHSAHLLPDGRVLLAGGISDLNGMLLALGTIVSSTDLFDPLTGLITPGPNLGVPRLAHLSASLPDGRVLLAGGASWRMVVILRVPFFSATSDLFDPATSTIRPGPALQVARGFSASIWLGNGKLLVVGGASGDLSQLGAPTASCELFDPVTERFTLTGPLATARANASLCLLADGRVLAAGGMQGDLFNPIALTSSEIYDPVSGTWSPGPNLGAGRAGALEAVLPDGTFLLMGGVAAGPGGMAQNTGEVFHP